MRTAARVLAARPLSCRGSAAWGMGPLPLPSLALATPRVEETGHCRPSGRIRDVADRADGMDEPGCPRLRDVAERRDACGWRWK